MVEDKKSSEEPASQVDAPADVGTGQKPTGKRRKRTMVIGIVVAVILVAGVGFFAWHSQPTFCNAVCHTPMDSYVESYYKTDGTSLAAVHMKAGKNCLTCHPANIGEQMTEAGNWITGNYAFDGDSSKLISRSDKYATQDFCLNENCHNLTLDQLKDKTKSMAWNPHDFSEHGVTECGSCHKMHGQSTIVCSECHYQAVDSAPSGWSTVPYREEK